MMLRLFYLIRYGTFLLILSCLFCSCSSGSGSNDNETIFLTEQLIRPLIDALACITGKQEVVDDHGNVTGETPCSADYKKAHDLLASFVTQLEGYQQNIIPYPISQTVLEHADDLSKKLKEAIASLSDSQDKNQFNTEWQVLDRTISGLMAEKNRQQGSTTDYSPAG